MQDKLVSETQKYVDLANELYDLNIPYLRVSFDLKGACAGTGSGYRNHVRYNLDIVKTDPEKFLRRTVPHEVAHVVVHHRGGKSSSHGPKWKETMRDFGVQDITRCHSYDMTDVPVRRQIKFLAYCGCSEHKISTTIRNKMLRGQGRICSSCKGKLYFK